MKFPRDWLGLACAVAAALLCTLIGQAMVPRFDIVNVAMVYLLAVVVIALCFSRGASILCVVLCVAAFDFMFVPPQGTFTVNDIQYLFTFAIMLVVALVISHLIESSRRQAEARAALALEAEAGRMRSTLLASISHDLRTPLAVMAGASSTLAEGGERISSAERADLARSIYAQARDMTELVGKVLQMTRIELGGIALERDWASMHEIVGSVLARLSDRLSEHRVMVGVPPELPLVRVDAPLIEQALTNLVENAARHTPPGTVVHVRAYDRRDADQHELIVSVEDSGPGLPQEHVDRMFTMFHGHGTRMSGESASRGAGLGLAICRAIVHLHGGTIWAEPLPDRGIAFRFALAVDDAPRPPDE